MLPAIEHFDASNGIRIYRLPLRAFPGGFIAYAYLLLGAGVPTLVDTGSGFEDSNQDLLDGIAATGEPLELADIRRILVTHGHIDHFGGVGFMQERTGAQVAIHELDRRVLTNYEERVSVATKDLRVYLERAGVKPEFRHTLMEMYGFGKKHFRSVKVDFSLDDGMTLDGMQFIHTPGHCSGQVCVLVGDVLLSADHVLPRTTPNLAPESITHYTGLGHFFEALHKIRTLPGVRLALGGHEEPIHNFYQRVDDMIASHRRKLNRVLDLMREYGAPMTAIEVSKVMYPDKHGYDVLLAISEAGAHVEYLYQHGALSVANLDEVERDDNPALRYVVS